LIDKNSEGIFKNHQSPTEPFSKRFPKLLHIQRKTFQMELGIQKNPQDCPLQKFLRRLAEFDLMRVCEEMRISVLSISSFERVPKFH